MRQQTEGDLLLRAVRRQRLQEADPLAGPRRQDLLVQPAPLPVAMALGTPAWQTARWWRVCEGVTVSKCNGPGNNCLHTR